MKCKHTVKGKCTNKGVKGIYGTKCGGRFLNENKHCFVPNNKLDGLK